MKASFIKRLVSYFIDIIIVSTIVSVICVALPNKKDKTEESMYELSDSLLNKEITSEEYLAEYKKLTYQNQKNNFIENTVDVVIILAYFVVFQYMNKGQTLGKKLLHIQVVDNDSESPATMGKGFLRSIVILNIISSLLSVIFIYLIKEKPYMNIYLTMAEIESIAVFISVIFVLYRKDGRGLHDLFANTKVIEEKR